MANYKILVNGVAVGVGLFTTDEVKQVEKDFQIRLILIERK